MKSPFPRSRAALAGFLVLGLIFIIRPVSLHWNKVPVATEATPAASAPSNPLLATAKANPVPNAVATPASLTQPRSASHPLPRLEKLWQQTPSEPAFASFAEWTRSYTQARDLQTRQALEARGVELARQRKAALFSLIQTNPKRALELAVPVGVRRQLPAGVQALLETRISGRGDLDVMGVLPLPGQEREVVPLYRTTRIQSSEYRTFVYGARASQPTGRDLPLHGVAVDDVLALSENPVRLLEEGEAGTLSPAQLKDVYCPVSGEPVTANNEPTAVDVGGEIRFLCCYGHAEILNEQLQADANQAGGSGNGGGLAASPYTEGQKRIVLFRVAFPNVPTPALTVSAGQTLLANINDFWRRVSYGRTSAALAGEGSDVILVTLTQNTSVYDGDAGKLRADVRARATANGVDLSLYDFDITCVGNAPAYSFAGLGYVGAPGAWLANSYFGTATAVHELGHNLGFPHANFWDTGGQSDIGPGGNEEYGDIYDVMGSGGSTAGDYAVKFKWLAGWIPDADYPRIAVSGTYRIYVQDDPNSRGLRGLRFARNSGLDYSIEFRQRYAGNPWMMNGITLRWGSPTGSGSQLIDTTPGTLDYKDDAAIVIGRTFTDPDAQVHITPVGFGYTYPESMDVVVNLGSSPGNHPPTAAVGAGATATGIGSPLTFGVQASDSDGDALAYAWDFGDDTFGPNAATVQKNWSAAGQYVVRCTVSDMKGGTASDSILVQVGNPSSFTIRGHVFNNGQPLAGVLVKASSSRYAYSDSDGAYAIPGLGAGSYTVTANLYPYTLTSPWFSNPVTVGPDAVNRDFIAVASKLDDVVLVPENAVWKYLDNGSDPGTAWRGATFNDASWASGPAQLGYGDGDEATVVGYGSDPNNKYITTYFRHAFTVNNLAGMTNFNLHFLRDDGGAVYLNGAEILRDNLPSGTITATTRAVDNSEDTTLAAVNTAALLEGNNILAAEVHQVLPNSSDISFALSVTATSVTNVQSLSLFYIASPDDQQSFIDPISIPIFVNAYPSGSAFTKMEFLVDGQKIGEDDLPSFALSWSAPTPGSHTLTVRATDTEGAVALSPPIHVHVGSPPLGQTLVSAGSNWRYLDNGSDQGAAWREPDFNDGAWASGNAELGYGDGDEVTTVGFGPNGSAKFITTYFRHTFVVQDASLVTNAILRLVRDDGAVVYLNGTEVFRSNMPEGPIDYLTGASTAVGGADESTFQVAAVAPRWFVTGPNVVAVEIHQNSGSSSDISFNFGLDLLLSELPSRGVKWTGPANGSAWTAPAHLALAATAVAGPGLAISQVEFFDGDLSLGQDQAAPYSLDWNNAPLGSHLLTARAYESGGLILTSAPVTLTVSAPGVPSQLISAGAVWKYHDDGTDPGPGWAQPGYNDLAWPSGSARLGYGGDGEVSIVNFGPDPNFKYITTWFRKMFTVANPAQFQQLRLRLQRDDGAVVYLNGNEILRDNLRPGSISSGSLALTTVSGAEESEFFETVVPCAWLTAGNNLLAAEVHQQSPNSSDLGFDLELIGLTGTNLTSGIYLTHPGQNAQFNSESAVLLEAFAWTAPSSSLNRVDFYADGLKVGAASAAPYRYDWANPALGAHTLTAVAVDDQGGLLTSPPVEITVGHPQVSLTLVSRGSDWKYLDDGSNQGTAWAQPDYNDEAWASGPARLGYGSDGEVTTVGFGPNSNSKFITTYFRRVFNVPFDTVITNLDFRLQRDDGAVIWLNGQEAYRQNMPGGTISYNTLAASTVGAPNETAWFETSLRVSGLATGPNLAAVEVHQAAGTSSDLGFDLEIVGTGYLTHQPPPPLAIELAPFNRVNISWPESALGYELYYSSSLDPDSVWNRASTTIVTNNGMKTVNIPHTGRSRFFRLLRQ
jgi:PKD domain/Bacterial Ig domain/Carboxypeptidase regulatory-like domain